MRQPIRRSTGDDAFCKDVINAARSLGKAVKLARNGMLEDPGRGLVELKPK